MMVWVLCDGRRPYYPGGENSRGKVQNVVTDSSAKRISENCRTTISLRLLGQAHHTSTAGRKIEPAVGGRQTVPHWGFEGCT